MKLAAAWGIDPRTELPWHLETLGSTGRWLRHSTDEAPLPVLLVSAAPGCGLECFADALTARLCCLQPRDDGGACGHCKGCQQWLADTHPDVLTLRADPGQDIPVETARESIEALQLARHYKGLRLVRIAMTEQLTRSAANALLKTLEEPPARTLFLLLSLQPRAILATIRSRAQKLHLPTPSDASAEQWLAGQGVAQAATHLTRHAGQPLRALAAAQNDDDTEDFDQLVEAWQRNPADIDQVVRKLATSRDAALGFVDWLAAHSWQETRRAMAEMAPPETASVAQERFVLAQRCRSSLQAYTPPALALEALFVSWRALLSGARRHQ